MKRRALLPIFLSVALAIGAADARPGGGNSFRGGSSSGSRSSGSSSRSSGGSSGGFTGGSRSYTGTSYSSGDGGLFWLLLFMHPGASVTVFLIILIFVVLRSRAALRAADWSTVAPPEQEYRGPSPRSLLERLRSIDPNFSIVVFEDFVYALYTEVHTARGQGQIGRVSAYLTPVAQQALTSTGLREVRTIVIGAMRIIDASPPRGTEDAVRATIELETNYTEVSAEGREQAYYACERWALVRRAGTLSRTPDKARVIACPNCGAPIDGVVAGHCRYCNTDVCSGRFDWLVEGVELVSREARGPMLTGDTAEEGTDLPTIRDPSAVSLLARAATNDPAFDWGTIEKRVGAVFAEFQRAWSGRDLASMRPLMSETLFQTQTYWINTYLAQGLRNVTENAQIQAIELARVSSDRFFDAVTVRIFAKSLDYTVSDKDGKVVSGSRSKPRAYSEYWTLIRGRGAEPTPTEGKACPNCGAPLVINQAGICTYCNVKVSAGAFDWVLSRIEQDEVYTG